MYCSKCGEKHALNAKFCSNCGNQLGINSQTESDSKRKILFDGKIYKCPSCGATLNSFEHKCGVCGYELRGSDNSNVIKDFALKLERTKSVDKKNELISNFYIPNTKEDIYEFFILAISNITYDIRCEHAWKSKLEQTYHKAKLSFGNSSEFEYINKLYVKTMKQYKYRAFSKLLENGLKFIIGGIVIIVGVGLMIFGGFKGYESGDPDSPYYMLSVIAMMIAMGGIGILLWGKEKNKKTKNSKNDQEDYDEDDE